MFKDSIFGMTVKLSKVAIRCSLENAFLKISKNSQENVCVGVSFLTNLQDSDLQPYQK